MRQAWSSRSNGLCVPSKTDDTDTGTSECPCASSSLCHSLPLGAAKDANTSIPRVFAFHPARAIYNGSDNEWMSWDWNAITTVATVAFCPNKYCDYPIAYHPGVVDKPNVSKALLCHAHQHGARVHSFTYWNWNEPGTWKQLRNVTARKTWVDWQVGTVQRLGLDGVNVDIEGQYNHSLRASLTALICELQTALKAAVPGASVSFDLAIEPTYGPIEAGYDYVGLAKCLDTIVPMAYDMVDNGKAANSPLPAVLHGIDGYKRMGIPLAKLSVALPWYGYDIVCDDVQPDVDCVAPKGFPNRQPGLGEVLDLHAIVGAPPIVFNPVSVSKYFGTSRSTSSPALQSRS